MALQVDDNVELLDLMIKDHHEAPEEYKTTGRWVGYSERFLIYLKEKGLYDFRRQHAQKEENAHVLASFGACDLNLKEQGRPERLFHIANSCYLGEGARHITHLHPSTIGNPEGFLIDGIFYTRSWLNFYCRYAYVSKFIRFSDQLIVEVGSGSGKQAELLKKAHPDLTIVLFDLPTQLYVCHQYLTKVFEGTDTVVDYMQGREITSFAEIVPGKINILPHWKFDIIKHQPIDLLWNAASFQEMASPTAKHYLSIADKAKACFLMHLIAYDPDSPQPGNRGVIAPDVMSNFVEIDRTLARLVYTPETWRYFDSFWINRLYT